MTYTEAWEGLAGVGSELGSLLSPTAATRAPPAPAPTRSRRFAWA